MPGTTNYEATMFFVRSERRILSGHRNFAIYIKKIGCHFCGWINLKKLTTAADGIVRGKPIYYTDSIKVFPIILCLWGDYITHSPRDSNAATAVDDCCRCHYVDSFRVYSRGHESGSLCAHCCHSLIYHINGLDSWYFSNFSLYLRGIYKQPIFNASPFC